MSRIDQHSAFGFLMYYLIYILWTGSLLIEPELVGLIALFSMVPDLDVFYVFRILDIADPNFQHHFRSKMHNPLNYTFFIAIFIGALIFRFYPLYFLAAMLGVYSHFFFDSFASGDGIMWGKNPFKKNHYGRFVNLFSTRTDGFHGFYWYVRYHETVICKFGNACVLISAIIVQTLEIYSATYFVFNLIGNILYILVVVYFILGLILGSKKHYLLTSKLEELLKEPPNGRYQDYRINPNYINGLSEKNRKKHLKKYSHLLRNKEI